MNITPLSYRQIKKFLSSGDEGVEELIVNCEPVFEIIDDVNKEILNNEEITFNEFDRFSKNLTGAIMFLKSVSCQAESFRHNVKHEKIVQFKLSGEKGMTDNTVKSKAEIAIKDYYSLVTVLEGYIGRAYAGIKDCERKAINKKYEYKSLQKSEDE